MGSFAIMHPGNYGPLTAFDVSSGKVAWTAGGDAFFMPPTVEPLKTYEVADSATWAQPVVSGRRLFVKDASTLTLWTFD